MIGNSIAQSAQPIISFNFGRGNWQRVHSALHISLITALLCGLVSTAAFTLFPHLLVSMFLDTSVPAAQLAIEGFPYYSTGFIFFILNLAVIGYFQSVERVRPATTFALLRGFVLLLPSFMLLPEALGTRGIWLAMPLSEVLTTLCIATFFAMRRLSYRPSLR